MATTGMDRLFICVKEMESAVAFYRDTVGMAQVLDVHPEPAEVKQLWKLPSANARMVGLRMPENSTLVTLVEFKPSTGKEIRTGTEATWYGIHDLAFRVVNIDATTRMIKKMGLPFPAPPVEYKPVFAPFSVKEGLFLGPGNVPCALIERMLGQPQEESWKFTHIGDSTQIVESIEEALHFYVDQLGLDVLMNDSVPPGLLSEVLGVGPEVSCKLAMVNRKDTNALHIELMEVSAPPKYPAVPACPPNIGLFMVSLRVDSLESALKRLTGEKTPVWSGPVNLDRKVWGMQKACVVQGPGRSLVCLFEMD